MVIVERDGSVLRLKLNRPEVRNAFDEATIEALHAGIDAHPDVRAVVLTGEGKAFCAGGDLNWMRRAGERSIDENVADALRLAELYRKIEEHSAAVIVGVHGAAFGGGVGLVAAADVAIAEEAAKFAFSEVKLGLVPATISPFVLRKIGPGAARGLFVTGEPFDAEHALRIGLIQAMAGPGGLEDEIERILGHILAAGPKAVSASKRLASDPPLDIEAASRLLAETRASEEAREGLSAFLEKRAASFVESR